MASQEPKPQNGDHSHGKHSTESANYLSAFQKLCSEIYFHLPTATDNNKTTPLASPGTTPDLIIVCSWMNAQSRHIVKYTDAYITRYPTVPVLLVRCPQLGVMFKPERQQVHEMSPAVKAVQSVLATLTTQPKVLMHTFSNGGAWTSIMLSAAYQRATAGSNLPVTALVLDSCPSVPSMRLLHFELSKVLPRNFILRLVGSLLIWCILFIFKFMQRLGLSSGVVAKVRKDLNDPSGSFVKGGIRRLYICSDKDTVIPLQDVKLHAEEAKSALKQSGLSDDEAQRRVEFEEFKGSPHVGHMRVDQARYWRAVQKAWTDGLEIQGAKAGKIKN